MARGYLRSVRYPRGRYRHRIMKSRLLFPKARRMRLRKMMGRRRQKAEIKYRFDDEITTLVAPGAQGVVQISPGSIPVGSTRVQRIGNKIKSLRLTLVLHIYAVPTAVMAAPPFAHVRVVVANPRIGQADFLVDVGLSLTARESLNHHTATIMMDREFLLANNAQAANPDSVPITNGVSHRTFKRSFKIPRTITFRDGSDFITDPEDIFTMFIANLTSASISIAYIWRTKFSFIDV